MLYLSKNLGRPLSPLQIVEIIEATADDLGSKKVHADTVNDAPANGFDPVFGHGRINVWKALLAVANDGLSNHQPSAFPRPCWQLLGIQDIVLRNVGAR